MATANGRVSVCGEGRQAHLTAVMTQLDHCDDKKGSLSHDSPFSVSFHSPSTELTPFSLDFHPWILDSAF